MKKLSEKQFLERQERSFKAHQEANKVKDFMETKGFHYTISFYGVIYNPESKKHEYRRIEVFLNVIPSQIDVAAINHFFEEIKPYNYYSLYVYDAKDKEIMLIKGLD